LGQADYRLLAELGRQAGAHAHAVQLTTNLRRSQQRLMVAREEERRRLRRDLHDGLGPMLAGVRLGLEEVRRSMPKGHAAAAALACLGDQAQGAASEVRRLINDLRPTLLDEVGLVEALKQQAAHFSSPSGDPAGLEVTVGVPEMLGPLPAAVELAAYRIATEALANVARPAKSAPLHHPPIPQRRPTAADRGRRYWYWRVSLGSWHPVHAGTRCGRRGTCIIQPRSTGALLSPLSCRLS
jgi:two-component system NarL family sensor kinase